MHFLLQNESDIVVRARTCIRQLNAALDRDGSGSPPTPKLADSPQLGDVLPKARSITVELTTRIQESEDPHRLEELLDINDQLLALLKKIPRGTRPNLTIQGLGLTFDASASPQDDGDGKLDGLPHLNGLSPNTTASIESEAEDEEELLTPTTPKVDKGKRKAEPEEPEMILSPKTFRMAEGPDDEELAARYREGGITSPTDRLVFLQNLCPGEQFSYSQK